MSDAVTLYKAQPPIARTVTTVVFLASVAAYTGMISRDPFFFHPSLLFKFPPGIHRLVTSFLLTGPGLGVIFDTFMLFNYLSQLEKSNPKFTRKEDLIWYLVFVGGVIVVLNATIFGGLMFLPALLIAMAYTSTQDQRGMQAQMYIVTVPAQLTPYCLLLMWLLMGGWEASKVGVTGLLAAHLHDFLTRLYPEFGNGPNLIPTPSIFAHIMQTARVQKRDYGTAHIPASSSQSRSGPLPDSWRSVGPGRRLG